MEKGPPKVNIWWNVFLLIAASIICVSVSSAVVIILEAIIASVAATRIIAGVLNYDRL